MFASGPIQSLRQRMEWLNKNLNVQGGPKSDNIKHT